jgi:hypothetical protein
MFSAKCRQPVTDAVRSVRGGAMRWLRAVAISCGPDIAPRATRASTHPTLRGGLT